MVGVTYLSPGKKEFVIQSETGSKLITDRVLKKLLEAEREESRPEIEQQSALTDANYRFTLIGHENGLSGKAYVLEVEPGGRTNSSITVESGSMLETLPSCG